MSTRIAVRLVIAAIVPLAGCRDAPPTTAGPPATPSASAPASTAAPLVTTPPPTAPTPPTRWADLKASEQACVDCHPDHADAWFATKMGRSLLRIEGLSHAALRRPGSVVHPLTGLTYAQTNGRFTERAAPGVELSREAKYVIGSGNHAQSFLWAAEDQLYQLPLTWFSDQKRWDLSPGYEAMVDHPGTFREVTIDCLNCHTDPVPIRAGTRNRFEALPEGPIGCSRCHGDGRAHAEARLNGQDAPLVVPTRLSPERAADTCAVCHFGGAVRVLRAGKQWSDFLPGDTLSDVAAVFVRQQAGEGFSTTDHFSRLGMSPCAQKTPHMTCATCHPPHVTDPKGADDRSEPCRVCHGAGGRAEAHPCKGPGGKDCAGCHMDTGPSRNIPHVTAVDHFIRTRPTPAPARNNDSPLVWVARPEAEPQDADHQILLGRAYVAAWRADGQSKDAERAERYLNLGLAKAPDRLDGWLEMATLRRLRGDPQGERLAAEKAFALDPQSRRTAMLVGAARLATGDPEAALAALDRAAALAARAETETLRARALQLLGRMSEAVSAARTATVLQPSYAEAWLALGILADAERRYADALPALETAVRWQPGMVRAWLRLGAVQNRLGRAEAALATYEKAESLVGGDATARQLVAFGRAEAQIELGRTAEALPALEVLLREGLRAPGMPRAMGRAYVATGNFGEALDALEAAVKIDPDDLAAWEALATARQEMNLPLPAAEARNRAATLRARKK
jgi:tetratricopeptide (TPR) repeat protein